MGTRLPVSVLLLSGVLLAGALAVAGAAQSGFGPTGDSEPEQQTLPSADDVVIEIQLDEDGSAEWRQEHRIDLGQMEESSFGEIRRQIERNPAAFLDRTNYTQRVKTFATVAQEQTGREMVIENVSVEAFREPVGEFDGVITYQFTWHGFADVADDGTTMRAGRAFLPQMIPDSTTLIMNWPSGVTPAEVAPGPDERRDGAALWSGPEQFAADEPRVVLESESGSFGVVPWPGVGSNDQFLALITVGGALVTISLGGIVGVATIVRYRRGSDAETASEGTQTAGGAGTATSATEGTPDPDDELLSNEERVLALLETQNGRVKQQRLVEEFGWSETKTSEVVGELKDAGKIDVYRLGRENVLTLPEVRIDATDTESEGGNK
ncbi:hypothetical protein BRC62_04145 [Halobacteriales archaeon QH_10_67_13]|nr:MAG: hypothetical protein BRC62_04145 [Halobacteriales archaeon QH_10_67_13]